MEGQRYDIYETKRNTNDIKELKNLKIMTGAKKVLWYCLKKR